MKGNTKQLSTWIVRYRPTKSEASTVSVGDSIMFPPSFHVIIVSEGCVPLNVMKGLSAGTTIFSLLKHKLYIDTKLKIIPRQAH
jgi:hypothetical protein